MSDDADIWMGETYALRTFKAEDGRLTSISAGGDHWVDGICIATCHKKADHIPPVRKCTCGVYGFWTLPELLRQYEEHACRMVAVIRMDGERLQAENGVKTSRAQIVAWWCAEDDDELIAASLARIPPTREEGDGEVRVRRYYDRDLMLDDFPPPPVGERGERDSHGRHRETGATDHPGPGHADPTAGQEASPCTDPGAGACTGTGSGDVSLPSHPSNRVPSARRKNGGRGGHTNS